MENEDRNLQITSHDFLIYRNANDDVKVEVLLINNDILFESDENTLYLGKIKLKTAN